MLLNQPWMWRDSKLYFTSLPDDSVISPELHYCCREKTSFIRSKALDLLPFYIPRNFSLSLIPSPTYSASPSQSSSLTLNVHISFARMFTSLGMFDLIGTFPKHVTPLTSKTLYSLRIFFYLWLILFPLC